MAAPHAAIEAVRRGGSISISGVYGGAPEPMPMCQLFDRQIQLRMGQANVRAWTDGLLGRLVEDDPFGVGSAATHHLPLDDTPAAYGYFQKKEEGMVKVVLRP